MVTTQHAEGFTMQYTVRFRRFAANSPFRLAVLCLSVAVLPSLASGQAPCAPNLSKHMVETGQEVHQWLTQEAWHYFNSQITGSELGDHIGTWGVDGIFIDTAQTTVLDGARDEDKGYKPPLWQGNAEGLFDLDAPVFRHFCASAKDIYTGYYVGQQYDSNLTQAERIWQTNEADNMVLRYGQSDRTTAYYYLGHVAHLVQDMTIPAHTHNDPHGSNLVSMHESYEQDYAPTHFQEFHFDDTAGLEYILKGRPITIPASLYEAFQQTAEYTDDYDSNHKDGEYVTGGMDACFFPTDYPSSLLHRPSDAIRTGGGAASTMTDASCAVIAQDLMYWAMKRTAQMFRLFYHQVDTETFEGQILLANQNLAVAVEEGAPVPYLGPKNAALRVSYRTPTRNGFPASGVVKASCMVHYNHKPDGGDWTQEQSVSVPEGAGLVTLPTQRGLYRVWVTAENGAGTAATPIHGYFRAPGFGLVQPPVGGKVECTGTLRLNVVVTGAGDDAVYAWERDGQPIAGANSDTLTVSGVGYPDAGHYRCIITDPVEGTIVTPAALVEIVPENSLPAADMAGLACGAFLTLLLFAKISNRRGSGRKISQRT